MALLDITFLVSDDGTACEKVFLELLVLRHLGIDNQTLLEQK